MSLLPWIEPGAGEEALDLVPDVVPHAISLNVSSTCNLSCGYCYASRGSFGAESPRAMPEAVAMAAVDRLFTTAEPGAPITVGFLGGEPFARRDRIHAVVAHATRRAKAEGRDVRFSVTTNGTLLDAKDLELLRRHPFAVTVSVDGAPEVHDAQRPSPDGSSSFATMASHVAPLLRDPGAARISARATVTRRSLDLSTAFDAIVGVGFPEVGFSPLRASPGGDADALREDDWPTYFDRSIALARRELASMRAGRPGRFTNFIVALRRIGAGSSMPYPCGAGGGYASVGPEGDWYACHRAIGVPAYRLGGVEGPSPEVAARFLAARHVHAKEPCRDCWARYLCSGACHQEAAAITTASCDFIRGWLEFCLTTFAELAALGEPTSVLGRSS